ncbi:MAG TPA: hypothetical protein VFJ85_11165 [Acidimicrobiales bacterium]|nr:hypothetical protein [Acidimicrobiales bacterium]
MARILDILPSFETYAKKVFVDTPFMRAAKWKELYESAHPEVWAAFYAGQPGDEGRSAVAQEMSIVRDRVAAGGPALHRLIEDVEPLVRGALGLAPTPDPLHVLMVGPYSINVLVAPFGDDVALFHCVEWFQSEEGSRVLVAHEDTHAWHRLVLGGAPPAGDAAWTAFSEGLATRVSRQVVPGTDEADYFWFGHEGFEDWLPWCEEHRGELLGRFRDELDEPGTDDAFFGAGLVEKRWRVGYYLADLLVGAIDLPLPELVVLGVDDARAALRESLQRTS